MNGEHLEGGAAMPVQNEYTCYHIINDRNKSKNDLVENNVPLAIVLAPLRQLEPEPPLRQLVPELVHSHAPGVWHSCQPVK